MGNEARRRAKQARREKRRTEPKSRPRSGDPRIRTFVIIHESDGTADWTQYSAPVSLFKDAPTDEPGMTFECPRCGAMTYLEGILALSTMVQDLSSSRVLLQDGCVKCGTTMVAQQFGFQAADGAVLATHSFVLETFLEALLDDLRSGNITPDEAVTELADKAPNLHPIVEWIERRGATLTLVATVLLALLSYVHEQDDKSLSPDDIHKIVTTIESDLGDRAERDSEPSPTPSETEMPPAK